MLDLTRPAPGARLLGLVTTLYDETYGTLTEVREYDHGDPNTGSPGGLLRKRTISYAALTGLYDRPHLASLYDHSSGSDILKAQTTYNYDETSPTSPGWGTTPQHTTPTTARGNVTTVQSYVNGSSNLEKTFTYFDTGLVNTATDVNTAQTTYAYNSTGCPNSLPTGVSLPLSLSASATWDCDGGVMTSSTDQNNKTTTYYYGGTAAKSWYVSAVAYPDGGRLDIVPTVSTTNPWTVATYTKIDDTYSINTTTILDSLGRAVKQQLTSDPTGTVSVDTVYDVVGRVSTVTNPYRSTSDGITTYSYDALERILSIQHPDTSTANYTYTGAATRIQDEGVGGHRVARVLQQDGLGRTASVCEVTSVGLASENPDACGQDYAQTGFLTTYSFDAFDNVIKVQQHGLNDRTYQYDGLSRLTQETTPEAGTNTYTYDGTNAVGDLYQRVRPKPNQTNTQQTVTTTYAYDTLHRLAGLSYNDNSTPAVTFTYDSIPTGWGITGYNLNGRLTTEQVSFTSGAAIQTYSYDEMGRVKTKWNCVPSSCGTAPNAMQFTYDKAGNPLTYTNGKGDTFTQQFNPAAQLTSITGSRDSQHPLINSVAYNAFGAETGSTLGNNIARTRGYNARGWLTYITDGSIYNVNSSTSQIAYASNGDITSANDLVNGAWTYTYDDFNRLGSATKSGYSAIPYTYDRYGNRLIPDGNGGWTATFDSNNHINGGSYDAVGNLLSDGTYGYTYDAENRLISVSSGGTTTATYLYDASGRRVRATRSGTSVDFLYDLQGRAIVELNSSGAETRTEIYAAGSHLATYANSTTYFSHTDWLGTERARSDVNGALVSGESYTSNPFGDSMSPGTDGASPVHFTGLEHDSESGLDHAWYRKYSPNLSRWMTPDPAGLAAVDLSNPQSLNRYAYVLNTPTNLVDPDGLNPANPDDWATCNSEYPTDMIGYAHCVNDEPAGGSIDMGGDVGWPIGIGIGIGWGGLGSSGNSGQSGSTGNPGGIGNFPNGETLGLPTGYTFKPLNLWQLMGLQPIGNWCDFGPCVFGAEPGAAGSKKKWWPSIDITGCQIYDKSERPDLGAYCRWFGNSATSNSQRGCLLQYYDPKYYGNMGGYFDSVKKRKQSNFQLFGGMLGAAAHSYCLLEGAMRP